MRGKPKNNKPVVKGGICYDPEIGKRYKVGSGSWFILLQNIPAFRVEDKDNGSFTARREERSTNANYYWYAWRRVNTRLRKVYIGKSEEVTLLRLQKVAEEINLPDNIFWSSRMNQEVSQSGNELTELKSKVQQMEAEMLNIRLDNSILKMANSLAVSKLREALSKEKIPERTIKEALEALEQMWK